MTAEPSAVMLIWQLYRISLRPRKGHVQRETILKQGVNWWLWHHRIRFNLIGPLNLAGSTLFPSCRMLIFPRCAKRLAALRVGSSNGRHFCSSRCPAYSRAASLGQILEAEDREARSVRIVFSRALSISERPFFRQACEQYFTCCQLWRHFLRHWI